MTDRPGSFITFEGTDGSGKTTQMRLLGQRLRGSGHEVVETQEPGGTRIGIQIRKILLDAGNHELCPTAEMLLYFAARAQNFDEKILPAWRQGAVVLSDRFTDSTLAYQGEGRALGESVVLQLHEIACHGLEPDLTVCLDIDLATASERLQGRSAPDRMDAQPADFYRQVRSAYMDLAARFPDRIKIVDGKGGVGEVAERIWQVVEPAVKVRAGV